MVECLLLVLGLIAQRIIATVPVRPPELPPDREGNISCIGDQYGLNLPMINGFDPNLLTMQQLCALPQYGGQENLHIGGWCDARNDDGRRWHLSFDISPASGANPILANPRVMLACFYRCWCNFGRPRPELEQPREHPETVLSLEAETHKIMIDYVSDFDLNVPWQDHLRRRAREVINAIDRVVVQLAFPSLDTVGYVPRPNVQVNSTRLYIQPYPWTRSARHPTRPIRTSQVWGFPRIEAFDTAMDMNNQIDCPGELPRFPYPAHYSHSDFVSLQALCAVQSFGGRG